MFLAALEVQLIYRHLADHNEYLEGCGITVDADSFLKCGKKKKKIEVRNTLNYDKNNILANISSLVHVSTYFISNIHV